MEDVLGGVDRVGHGGAHDARGREHVVGEDGVVEERGVLERDRPRDRVRVPLGPGDPLGGEADGEAVERFGDGLGGDEGGEGAALLGAREQLVLREDGVLEALDLELRVEERLGVGDGGARGPDQVLGLEVEAVSVVARGRGAGGGVRSGRGGGEGESAERGGEVAVEGGEDAEVARAVEVETAGGRGERGGGGGRVRGLLPDLLRPEAVPVHGSGSAAGCRGRRGGDEEENEDGDGTGAGPGVPSRVGHGFQSSHAS
uniref:QUA1 n=1 Tax=Arundo donax TaxID=35708 RepID=A0A0A9A9L6_ARUDO